MVVIEPDSEVAISKTVQNSNEEAASDPNASYVDASDGFETASDGEHDEEDNNHNIHNQKQQEESASLKDESLNDSLNHEEQTQMVIAQVNDAKVDGNKLFIDGKFEDALVEYERALQAAPEGSSFVEIRSICHSNRAICFIKLGKYDDAVKECTKALELNPTYMKAIVRRAEAYQKLEHLDEAIADLKKVVEMDPSNDQARRSIRRLEPLAEVKREKMKAEMIGKLKEMGNSVLGKFGMSIDNFKAVKDPNTGSYSVSYQR